MSEKLLVLTEGGLISYDALLKEWILKSMISATQSDWNQTDESASDFIKNKPTSLPASDVPAWAKQSKKPTYTYSEVGAEAAGSVSSHNTSDSAHADIRASIAGVQDTLANKANKSHGNHVPTTETANNAKFLRNDNTWALVTPANIGAANAEHTHTIANVDGLQSALGEKVPGTRTVNGKALSANISLTAADVNADASGTANSKVSAHNTNTSAHSDIRSLIAGLTSRLNALADSDDDTLDQMSEVVAYIKSNKSLIEAVTTSKVNVSDIINNLTTNVSNKPLSAAQGVALKGLIDALQKTVDGKANASHDHDLSAMINKLSVGDSVPTDNDYYVAQYAGGGTTTTTYLRRPVSALLEYVKSKLAKVATSGSYNDLSNKPTIGNGTITISQNGSTKGTFTLNQTGNTTVTLADTNTWRGIQDNLTSTSTSDSLSANQGRLLANGSARDNTKLPLAGGTVTGRIIRSQGGSWGKDRNNVVVFNSATSENTYVPVVGVKTKDGAWTIGNIGNNEKLAFNYTTDANYNAGTNTSTTAYLPNQGGTIITSASIGEYTSKYATALTTSAGSATTPIYFSSGKPVACSYSLNKTVPSNAVFTDENVRQNAVTASEYSNWRPLIFGESNSTTEGFSPTTTTGKVYSVQTLSVQPSTGTIKAATFKGNLTGDASNALKLGGYSLSSSASNNTVALRTGNGFLYATYFNQSSSAETPTTSSYLIFANSDGFFRKTTLAGVKTILGLGSAAYTNSSAYAAASHNHSYLPLSGGSISGDLSISGTTQSSIFTATTKMNLVQGLVKNLTASGRTNLFGDGIAISNPAIRTDQGWIRMTGTGEGDSVLEIATGDDGAEQIVVRQYNTSNAVVHQANLLDASGATTFPVSVTAPKFIGTLQGNAATASTATKLATARTISLSGFSSGSAKFDGSGNIEIADWGYSTNRYVTTADTNTPYWRIAYVETSGNYENRSMIFVIDSGYKGGGFGIVKVAFRSNDISTANQSSCSCIWLVRQGFSADQLFVKGYAPAGGTQYADLYFKANKTYSAVNIRVLTCGGRVGYARAWALASSDTACRAAADIRTYSYTTEGSDGGTANYSNAVLDSQDGNTIKITYAKAGQSTTSWLASWNGRELGAISPSLLSVKYATSAGSATTAGSLNAANTTLSTGHENSEIKIKGNANGSLGSGNLALRTAIDFRWYSTYWQIGNLRGSSTDSAGFGFAYSVDGTTYALKAKITPDGVISATKFSGALEGNATSASTATKANALTLYQGVDNAARYVIFQDSNNSTSTLSAHYDADFKYNPSTNTLYIPKIVATSPMTTSAGKVSGFDTGQMGIFSNGIAISNPGTINDQGWIRMLGTGESDSVLEIATGDDGGDSATCEQIVVRQYNTKNAIAKQATLLDTAGKTTFPVSVTAPTFIGSLSGNATSATSASKLTPADNSITTAPSNGCLNYSSSIPSSTAGLFSTGNNANGIISFSKHSGNYVSQLGFNSYGNIYYRNFNNVALNSTQGWSQIAFTTSSITGNAATATKATQDSAGQQINKTYIKALSVSGRTITYTRGDGTTGTITTQDTNTTYSLSSFGITATAAELNYTDGVTSNIQTQLNSKAAASHSHSYLPLSGGTMTGNITFTSIGDAGTSKGIYWSGSTDGASIYYKTDGADLGRLVLNLTDDTNTRIDFALNGTTKSYIDANGNFSGNANTATTATQLSTSAGSSTQPVYFSGGKPVACSYTLGKSVPSNAVFTDTNTHWTTRIYAGASGAASHAATSNPYIKITDDNTYRNQLRIIGSGATSVSSDASGNITISSTNTTYSSLKNPYSITIQANGTSLGSYDGSSAKTFNITPANIGAVPQCVAVRTTGQDLNNYTTDGWYYFASDYKPTNIPAGSNGWLQVITATLSTGTYCKQLWYRLGTTNSNDFHIFVRTRSTTTWSNWAMVITNVVTTDMYGTSLPSAGRKGRIFFKKA